MQFLPQIILDALEEEGGEVYSVGGCTRDLFLHETPKDIDLEIHNLTAEQLVAVLSQFGNVSLIGKSFGVYQIAGMDIDFSLPRTESKFGPGHKDFDVTVDPYMGVVESARRRDFTINAIYMNEGNGEIIDPFGGEEDIDQRVLRVVDPKTFVEDPLRVLRGAQFCARFGLVAEKETIRLCRRIKNEYNTIPKERVMGELEKLLLKGMYPSLGIQFLRDTEWLEHWPELNNLWGVPQDPGHHPEGDVDKHVLEVIDRAGGISTMLWANDRLVYMLAALLHDVGKYTHTYYRTEPKHLTHWKASRPNNSRIVSYGHDHAGEELALSFLQRVTEETELLERVPRLVKHHMSPLLMQNSRDKGFRKLAKEGAEMEMIGYLSWADKGQRPSWWFDKISKLTLHGPKETAVQGRDVLDRGYPQGPKVGEIIRQCEDIFINRGIEDPKVLLDMVVGKKR
jgi:tRNA nucleotidyltransferase (CCA-adding enzyme)